MLLFSQIEFEDDSLLSVRREDVYKASEELPLKVRQRLVSEEQNMPVHIVTKVSASLFVRLGTRGIVTAGCSFRFE